MQAPLDRAFAALADPTRRAIIDRLARGPSRVTDMAEPFAMSLNAVSKHIKVLEQAGLLRRVRIGREHHLTLEAAPLREVVQWTSQYERFWNDRLDRLEAFLTTPPQTAPAAPNKKDR
ncbi:ArsR/SmtB family transcription factor [Pendulispora albinea]|uniref:Metalloregulator ArsR/SmtB family transcription factor n=1 Tax=Pendulispora albinea TaxID=2741071 RepID=A0ABZ2M945_9BACT